jgi:hypothetical protein
MAVTLAVTGVVAGVAWAAPGEPMGGPTAAVALVRVKTLLQRELAGVPEHAVAGRRRRARSARASVTLVDRDGDPLAQGEVEMAGDGSWPLAGSWACASGSPAPPSR